MSVKQFGSRLGPTFELFAKFISRRKKLPLVGKELISFGSFEITEPIWIYLKLNIAQA